MTSPSPTTTQGPSADAKRQLRRGWTTGATAAAAAGAAFEALLTGHFPDTASVRLPGAETPVFTLTSHHLDDGVARVGIIKDAGDDPDITHGMEIIAEVRSGEKNSNITFHAGEGVGRVTLKGLALDVGEAAINPGPRKQISDTLEHVAQKLGHTGPLDISVTVSIPGGEAAAMKTQNPRLGIVGGLSVLGTTGIVVPYSCASWIHAIHRGVDVAREQNLHHLLASTGRTSEAGASKILNLPEHAIIDMGDFAGGMLKYLRKHPARHLTIAGGFAKLVKLAAGAMDLHSDRSQVDFVLLSKLVGECGGDKNLTDITKHATSAAQVLQGAGDLGPKLAHLVALRAREVALATLSGGTEVDVWVFDRTGTRIAASNEGTRIAASGEKQSNLET